MGDYGHRKCRLGLVTAGKAKGKRVCGLLGRLQLASAAESTEDNNHYTIHYYNSSHLIVF